MLIAVAEDATLDINTPVPVLAGKQFPNQLTQTLTLQMDENREGNMMMDFVDAQDALEGNMPKQYEKGRKSMGRRVSFAATAKVRLFDRPDSNRGTEPDDMDLDSDCNEQERTTSPLKAPGTPSATLPQVLSPKSAASLPSRIPIRSPLSKPSPSGSFEIDLGEVRDERQSESESLSSFNEEGTVLNWIEIMRTTPWILPLALGESLLKWHFKDFPRQTPWTLLDVLGGS